MQYNNYAHIELDIIAKNKNAIGNSANYKNLAQWGDSTGANVTTVGSNGDPSPYGLFDTSGQVYEWTENSVAVAGDKVRLKICRGGCYADTTSYGVSKENAKHFDIDSMLNEGFFGCRLATISNPYNYDNFINIANTGNSPDKCDFFQFGSVAYAYQINKYLLTNNEYCSFLNTIDPSGSNIDNIYDNRMDTSPVGGISLVQCNYLGNKYVVKNNMLDKPVTFIKWTMAAKYANWLHNNKSSNPQDIYNGSYDLNDLDEHIYRQNGAKYFLPNENEWYKAAYYDPTNTSYWTYGTRSDSDPLAIIPDSLGSGLYVEGYYSSTKTFPILIDKINDTFSVFSSESITTFDPTNPCPIISIESSANKESSDRNIYKINAEISNLEYGKKYDYSFSSAFANWPTKITPLSGSFTAYSDKQEINGILEFCPKNYRDISICNSNLQYLEINDIDDNYLINLNLNIVSSNNCFQTQSSSITATFDSLPNISTQSKYLNIEFLDSHDNSIIVSGELCCQPIPIIISVSGHQKAEVYNYTIESSSNNISFIPNSGTVSFGNQIGKITAYATGLGILNNNISILTAKVFKDDIISTDQVLLQCISDCETSCDNYANFNNKAIWGDCGGTCPDTNLPLLVGLVTTVGTNGGPGPYGTYDMDGNVYEIVAGGYTIRVDDYTPPTGWVVSQTPMVMGGSFKSNVVGKTARLASSEPEKDDVGFRIGSYSNPYNYPDFLPVNDVGSPLPSGNESDSSYNNFGKVKHEFMIAKYPVTNCEYAEFLNSVASTGVSLSDVNSVYSPLMSGCYGGIDRITCTNTYAYYVQDCMDHKPVRFLPSLAALKYVNWLENNKEPGWNSAISGAYHSSFGAGRRKDCAKYFIPSLDEWFKAAYYKGSNSGDTTAGYWNYSTQASRLPEPVSASGCGHGYTRPECDQRIIPPPCDPVPTPLLCSQTPTPTPTITPTITPTPSSTPDCNTDWNPAECIDKPFLCPEILDDGKLSEGSSIPSLLILSVPTTLFINGNTYIYDSISDSWISGSNYLIVSGDGFFILVENGEECKFRARARYRQIYDDYVLAEFSEMINCPESCYYYYISPLNINLIP